MASTKKWYVLLKVQILFLHFLYLVAVSQGQQRNKKKQLSASVAQNSNVMMILLEQFVQKTYFDLFLFLKVVKTYKE